MSPPTQQQQQQQQKKKKKNLRPCVCALNFASDGGAACLGVRRSGPGMEERRANMQTGTASRRNKLRILLSGAACIRIRLMFRLCFRAFGWEKDAAEAKP